MEMDSSRATRTANLGPAGIVLGKISVDVYQQLIAIVQFFFCREPAYYIALETEQYRSLVACAQSEINGRGIPQQVIDENRTGFEAIFGKGPLVFEIARLRAVRPVKGIGEVQEAIGWHREVFYNTAGNQSINVWIPISNVNAESALHFLPDSHLIPDEQLQLEDRVDPTVPVGSPGYEIGLLTTEKRIMGGVDFSLSRPMTVCPGEMVCFSGKLLHGSGHNRTDSLRFSIDFRVWAQ